MLAINSHNGEWLVSAEKWNGQTVVYANDPRSSAPDQNMANFVALVPGDDAKAEAVAAMLAAAPDMLAALQKIADEPCDHGPMDFCPRELARAAIAKATGKSA